MGIVVSDPLRGKSRDQGRPETRGDQRPDEMRQRETRDQGRRGREKLEAKERPETKGRPETTADEAE